MSRTHPELSFQRHMNMRLSRELLGILPLLNMLSASSAFSFSRTSRKIALSQKRNINSSTFLRALTNNPNFSQFSSTSNKILFSRNECLRCDRGSYCHYPSSTRHYSATPSDIDSSPDTGSNFFFEGKLVSFTSAGDGIGLAAVKVKDDVIQGILNSSDQELNSEGEGSNIFGSASNAPKGSNNNGAGQGDDLYGRTVVCKTTSGEEKTGIVVAQRHPVAFVLCNFDTFDEESTSISILKSKSQISVSPELIGSTLDCFGNDLSTSETKPNTEAENIFSNAIFSPIPKVDEISVINAPLLTGISTIDVLTPIGKGQNMLLIGNDADQRRNIIIDILTKQVKEGTKCIYASTSSANEDKSATLSILKESGLGEKIITICARDHIDATSFSTSAAEAVTVSSSACSIAEVFAREKGEDTLVIIDALDEHKNLWDATTRTLVDLYGVDAVVQGDISGSASSEMRGFYSGLVQRSAKFNNVKGGGSLTLILVCSVLNDDSNEDEDKMEFKSEDFDQTSEKIKERIAKLVQAKIPLTAATLKKIQIPIPISNDNRNSFRLSMQHIDDLISMSDGQIWLTTPDEGSNNLILDVQRSITRVGIGADTQSRADAPALQALTGGIRFELAQALDTLETTEEQRSTADFKSITKRDALLLAMYQEPGHTRSLSEECVALLAVKIGELDNVVNNMSRDDAVKEVRNMLEFVWKNAGEEMQAVDDTLDFASNDSLPILEKAIKDYFN